MAKPDRSIPKDIISDISIAISLLKKHKNAALAGIGGHDLRNCPVALSYCVDATTTWSELWLEEREKLIREGWSRKIYNTFTEFYDEYGQDGKPFPNERVIREMLLTE